MIMKSKFEKILKDQNGIVTTSECVKQGITTAFLSREVKSGNLERVAHGVYVALYADYDEYYLLQLVNKRVVFSHMSALYLHELIDRVPFGIEITIPDNYNASHIESDVKIYKTLRKFHEIGLTNLKTIHGNIVKSYNMERTMIDIIRKKNHIDIEIYTKAIQAYFKTKNRDYHLLREYAKIFKVEDEINNLLEVIG